MTPNIIKKFLNERHIIIIANGLTSVGDSSIIGVGGDEVDTESFDWVHTLNEKQKIKFFGGKTKAALFDAGLLNREDYFKPLKNIDLTGILIPDNTALNHSIIGDYKQPSKDFPNGRLSGGGHTAAAMDKRGLIYNIVRTDSNGVMFGNVPGHKETFKRIGEGQIWFPQNWTQYDIYSAGIYTANRGSVIDALRKEAVYKSINIRVMSDSSGKIVSIFPNYNQQGGVKK